MLYCVNCLLFATQGVRDTAALVLMKSHCNAAVTTLQMAFSLLFIATKRVDGGKAEKYSPHNEKAKEPLKAPPLCVHALNKFLNAHPLLRPVNNPSGSKACDN